MKKRILFIIILSALVGLGFYGNRGLFEEASTAYAVGDLDISYLGGPLPSPLFSVIGMAPGDMDDKDIDVTNNDTVARFVAVKGVRTGPDGESNPKLESVLEIVISEGGVDIYGGTLGAKTVADFFGESGGPNGLPLSAVDDGDSTTYNFEVTFPESADDDFQGKSVIFDLTFGIITGDNLVINEVYYGVDADHGFDSPKDRGILGINGNNATIIIEDNGAGSTNTANVSIKNICKITQQNNADVRNAVQVFTNTGGNSANGNTGGNTTVESGDANVFISFFSFLNFNFGSCNGRKLGQNDEWVELYNPTDHDISLKNWTITDNSDNPTRIRSNSRIKAGGFALLSKSSSTWRYWDENRRAKKVRLGGNIGDGLDNGGDHLILKNPDGDEVDKMSWGSDESGFTPPGTNPTVPLGDSTERLTPGFDTDMAPDWSAQYPPDPGE